MKLVLLLAFYIFTAHAQQTIDKLNTNQLKLPKESSNRALILDGAGQVKSSSTISDTELGYLEGLSDTLVNLLSGKANDSDVLKLTGNQSVDGIKTFTGKLVAQSTVNGSTPCPVMSETQRNAFTPVQGDCVYNSTTLKLNVFDGSVWKDAGGAGGISLWLTANPYNINDIVIESDKIYRALIAHTSGTFATDLAANRWVEVSASPTTPYSLANGGTNKALTAVNGGIVWVDADSFEILSAGVSGQILQSNGAAAPSWVNKSVTGQSQNGSDVTVEKIQVPNNLLTQTGTNTHLSENGNNNILSNPSFEHSSYLTSWTSSGTGSNAQELVNEIHGLKSVAITTSSQTINLSQSSTLYASQFADGVQGLASIRVKTNHTGTCSVCSVQAGTVSTTNCVSVQSHNKWGLYKVPMILGATSNGISLACTSGTGLTYVDDAFVGAVDLKADVDQSRFFGSLRYAGVASCSWSTSSTTNTDFSADTDCNTPIVSGNASAPTTKIPQINLTGMTAGKEYLVVAKFLGRKTLTNNGAYFFLTDGSNNAIDSVYFAVTTAAAPGTAAPDIPQSLLGRFTATGSTASFKIRARAESSGSAEIPAFNSDFNLEFLVYEFNSGSVYTSTNADTDWASCGHVPADFQGFGTVTAIETQCKREGSDLLMRGKFTSGTSTAVEARVNLKLGGAALTSAGSSVIPTTQKSGSFANGGTSTAPKGGFVLIQPSVSYLNFSSANTISGTSVDPNAIATGLNVSNTNAIILISEVRIPTSGWTNSNLIIGQFNEVQTAPGISKPKSCTITNAGATNTTICSASPCTEYNDTCGTASACTRSSAGTYSCVWGNGTWAPSSYVSCSVSGGQTINSAAITTPVSDSNGSFTLSPRIFATGGALTDTFFTATCVGVGP